MRLNPNVVIGYVDQELGAFNVEQGRYDWLSSRVDVSEGQIKRVLLQAGIAYRDFDQSVVTLSGGEKARMMFMALQLQAPNFIILDEPTNHIDLESREQLEAQLLESGATLLVTSHDRRFLQAVCNRFWMIDAGRLIEVDSLDDYYDDVVGWQTSTSTPVRIAPCRPMPSWKAMMLCWRASMSWRRLLQADLARKPKFQKPRRQAEWQQELDALWARLDP